MASVRPTKNGTFEIRFTFDGKRRHYFPGPKVRTEPRAVDIGKILDRLASSIENDESVPKFVASWLATLPDAQYKRLTGWGLVERRPARKADNEHPLAAWITTYLAHGERKPSTTRQIENVARNLKTFFGDDRPIQSITTSDAEDFRVWLLTEGREVAEDAPARGLAQNTVRRRLGRSREIFNLAVRRKLIKTNPFAEEKVSVGTDPDRQFFVPHEWIERCIRVAECEDWRIMLAFARYAGMRSHETRMQRWSDIDIPNRQMTIRSNKCPPSRLCPIFPELLPHLLRAREYGSQGELVVTRYSPEAGINETFKKIVKRAGLTAWPKLMQNLRATRETELLGVFPMKDVTSWIGNSEPIAMKHYAMTMQASFTRAIEQGTMTSTPRLPQNPTHSTAEIGIQEDAQDFEEIENPGKSGDLHSDAIPSNHDKYRRRDSNPHWIAPTGF